MNRSQQVENITWHCSAGFGNIYGIQDWWRNGLKWKSKGYSIVIDLYGVIWYLKSNNLEHGYTTNPDLFDINLITNGVKGYNSKMISACTIGGVEKMIVNGKTVFKAKDTRNIAQIAAQHKVNKFLIEKLKENGKDITKNLGIVGHRDYSIDNNKNGVIESYERIKECPSYDVISEFGYLYGSKDRYGKLPTAA